MNYKIIGKYIKDLKFEIPNPKAFFLLEKNISNYKINIDIKSHRFKDKIIEIDGEITEKKSLEEIILIKVPNEIYPEIRLLFILLFEKSGFNKIKIEEKIDFKKLHTRETIQ